MRDENCIFCKIAAGEIPSATLYEDDDFRVILDIEPASKGHALILRRSIMQIYTNWMMRLQRKYLCLQKRL